MLHVSRGSYGVYVAVTWSMWLLRGLWQFVSQVSPCVAHTRWLYAKVWPWHKIVLFHFNLYLYLNPLKTSPEYTWAEVLWEMHVIAKSNRLQRVNTVQAWKSLPLSDQLFSVIAPWKQPFWKFPFSPLCLFYDECGAPQHINKDLGHRISTTNWNFICEIKYSNVLDVFSTAISLPAYQVRLTSLSVKWYMNHSLFTEGYCSLYLYL